MDSEGEPVTVSLSGDARRNVIVWMDHRAVKQAERINMSNSPVLQYCGGSLSPEMQPPKVLMQITGNLVVYSETLACLFMLCIYFYIMFNINYFSSFYG